MDPHDPSEGAAAPTATPAPTAASSIFPHGAVQRLRAAQVCSEADTEQRNTRLAEGLFWERVKLHLRRGETRREASAVQAEAEAQAVRHCERVLPPSMAQAVGDGALRCRPAAQVAHGTQAVRQAAAEALYRTSAVLAGSGADLHDMVEYVHKREIVVPHTQSEEVESPAPSPQARHRLQSLQRKYRRMGSRPASKGRGKRRGTAADVLQEGNAAWGLLHEYLPDVPAHSVPEAPAIPVCPAEALGIVRDMTSRHTPHITASQAVESQLHTSAALLAEAARVLPPTP